MPVPIWPIAKLANDDDDQHDVHRVRQLAARHRPDARRRLGRELVRSVTRRGVAPPRRRQTLLRVDVEGASGLVAVTECHSCLVGDSLDVCVRHGIGSPRCGSTAVGRRAQSAPSVATSRALIVWSRFSAWSNTMLDGDSNTSLVTSRPVGHAGVLHDLAADDRVRVVVRGEAVHELRLAVARSRRAARG